MTCAEPEYTALQEFLGLLDEIESADPNSDSGEEREEKPLTVDHVEAIHPDEFDRKFRNTRPLVFTRGASCWPSMQILSDPRRLCALYEDEGEENVLLLRSRDNENFLKVDCRRELTRFSAAMAAVLAPSTAPSTSSATTRLRSYARAPICRLLQTALADDVRSLAECMGDVPVNFDNCGVWFGTAGNVTPTHYDLCHGFLVQLVGSKRFTYFQPDDFRFLYQRDSQPELSQVNLRDWYDATREGHQRERAAHPHVAEAQRISATIGPGDIIYTPPFWWHHVETADDGASISLLVPFDRTPEEGTHPAHLSH